MFKIKRRIEEEIDVKLSLNFDCSSNFAGVCIFVQAVVIAYSSIL